MLVQIDICITHVVHIGLKITDISLMVSADLQQSITHVPLDF